MALRINGIQIDDATIAQEIERLRPQYVDYFSDQEPEEEEETLLSWAQENIIEEVLIQEEVQKRGIRVSKNEVYRAFQDLVRKFGSPEALYQHFETTQKDKPAIRLFLQKRLAIKKLFDSVCTDPTRSRGEQEEAFIEELRAHANIQIDSPYERPRKKLTSVLVKPAGPDCNLACTYCFYLKKAALFTETKVHRMSAHVLEETVRQAVTQADKEISFAWQGGEPTLMGLPFFETAIELQKKFAGSTKVGNGLQTNGILLNPDWAAFLKNNHFLVGLSLDGPKHVHDHYRLFKGGKGSWEQVTDRAKMLLDAGVDVNVLTVVSDYSARFPEEIYNFHKSLGLRHMQFIPVVETHPRIPTEAAPFSVLPQAYGEFLKKIFDLWWQDFRHGMPTTFVRYFDSVFFNYVGLEPPDCELKRACGVYVVVEHNGDVYACDFFVEPRWKLGNVLHDRLTDLLNSSRQFHFGQFKAILPSECLSCPWRPYCWGGCPKDRIRDPRDNGSNHFCQSYKMFFEHAHARLQVLARKWRLGAMGQKF